jgi:ATP-dependent DNA helicase RecG
MSMQGVATSADIPQRVLSGSDFQLLYPAESDRVERKSGASPERLAEAMVAFSNADGGHILIGVTDDGELLPRRLTGAVDRNVHQAARNARNLGPYSAEQLLVDGTPLVLVTVGRCPTGVAQMSDGRVLARRGASNTPLFGADLLALMQRRSHERFEETDSQVPLRRASRAALRQLQDAYGWDPDELPQRLAERGLLRPETSTLTVAGALLLCDPLPRRFSKALVEVRRYTDEDSVDYTLREAFAGPLWRQIMQARDVILHELGTEMLISGLYRREVPRLPEVVVRETLANAVAHRDYELLGSPTIVEVRPTRVIVTSPGRLPAGVTPENLRTAQAARNVDVIQVLRRLGLAEDAGRGINKIVDAMAGALLAEPTFAEAGEAVRVELPIVGATAPQERAWVMALVDRGQLEPAEKVLLVAAARGERLTNSRARELVGGDSRNAGQWLGHLHRLGLLVKAGSRGGTNYVIDPSVAPGGAPILDVDRAKRTLLDQARDGALTNGAVRRLLGLDSVAARRLLQELVEEGALVRVGERRLTTYELTPQGVRALRGRAAQRRPDGQEDRGNRRRRRKA